MKIAAIKRLVEAYDVHVLMAAEEAIVEGEEMKINVEGEDEGEQLTHILAAIWIKTEMKKEGWDYKTALREYTKKVRTSIS